MHHFIDFNPYVAFSHDRETGVVSELHIISERFIHFWKQLLIPSHLIVVSIIQVLSAGYFITFLFNICHQQPFFLSLSHIILVFILLLRTFILKMSKFMTVIGLHSWFVKRTLSAFPSSTTSRTASTFYSSWWINLLTNIQSLLFHFMTGHPLFMYH